ncbi:sperm microtubule inner protein 11-like [Liolophura sinensis]|uniref:sperm microtubule inner protein 11-like n=1 Tax=Liolophura sinensis TaxID=3198878 RepID=UPI003158B99C
MAFFGLTHLGHQNILREATIEAKLQRGHTTLGFTALPPLTASNTRQRSIVPINQTSGYGPGHQGSYVEYTKMRTKHIRNHTDPMSIYRYPLTTSQNYGWLRMDRSLREKLPWTHVARYPQVNSEMTRFVDEMATTNREFRLF